MQNAKPITPKAPQKAQAPELPELIFTHQAIAPSVIKAEFSNGQDELAVFDQREVMASSGERFIGSVERWHAGHGIECPRNGLVANLIQTGERYSVTAVLTAGDLLDLASKLLDMATYMGANAATKGGVQ